MQICDCDAFYVLKALQNILVYVHLQRYFIDKTDVQNQFGSEQCELNSYCSICTNPPVGTNTECIMLRSMSTKPIVGTH